MLLQHPVPVTLLFPFKWYFLLKRKVIIVKFIDSLFEDKCKISLFYYLLEPPPRLKTGIKFAQASLRNSAGVLHPTFPCSWSHDVRESFTPGECLSQLSGSKGYMPTWLSIHEAHSPVSPWFILTACKAGCILQIRWLCSWETVICPRSRRPSLWLPCPDLSLPCWWWTVRTSLLILPIWFVAYVVFLWGSLGSGREGGGCSMLFTWRGPPLEACGDNTVWRKRAQGGFLKVLTRGPWTFSSAQPSGSFLIFNLCPSPWNLLIWIFAQGHVPSRMGPCHLISPICWFSGWSLDAGWFLDPSLPLWERGPHGEEHRL